MKLADLTNLQPAVLTGLIKEFNEPPETPVTKLFAESPIQCQAGVAQWDVEEWGRGIAGHVTSDAQAQPATLIGTKQQVAVPARIFLNKKIPNSYFANIRAGGEIDPMGAAAINRKVADELEDMKHTIFRTMEEAASQALYGTLTINSTIDKVSKAMATVTFPIQADSATATWDSATTKILTSSTEFPQIRKEMKEYGYKPRKVIATQELSDAFLANTQVAALISDRASDELMKDYELRLLNGLNLKYWDEGYLNSSDVWTSYLTATRAVFLPENTRGVLGMCYSPEYIPTSVGFKGDASNIEMKAVLGLFAYSEVQLNPVSIVIYAGINYLPVIMKPKAVYNFKWKI